MKRLTARLTLAAASLLAALPAAVQAQPVLDLASADGGVSLKASIGSLHWLRAWLPGTALDPFQPTFLGGVNVAAGDIGGAPLRRGLVIHARTSARDFEPYFTLTLQDTLVSWAAAAGGSHSKWLQLEAVSGPLLRYRPLRPDGTRAEPVFGAWDRDGRFFGDPAVFGALREMGAVQGPDGTLSITGVVTEPTR
jgi:hypothetical protein